MNLYYIVTNDGFLKRYYSETDLPTGVNTNTVATFSVTLRGAKSFNSIEKAKKITIEKSIINCIIINQNGVKQIF